MTIAANPALRELLEKRAYGHIVTTNSDGSAQVSMVWMDVHDGTVSFNTSTGTLKARNLRRDPRVTISVQNPDDLQQYAVLYGRVTFNETQAMVQLNRLAKKFLDLDTYPWLRPNETRVTVDIALDRVTGSGPWVPDAAAD